MYSLVTTPREGRRTFETFETDRALFLYLESIGVTYYPEVGATRLADGTVYEYGRVGH